ncbi:MAG: ribonuclease R [candidate division KSB1 bacterium]|nr:ribonuclease R [candidate division KSB1 bacterium]MDZ7274669.1 ribonuclease R [candidate division KSB1 bacterium]MDZ7285494.1 ribonuclease R [candidate division KSB1 bacterium]MDZ7298526.1 ribonuclease R [candidate division KSB1 bacterium]MDZ7306250.1 ribonuclease R [candidate division KSB1 bacterium]
MKDLIERTLEVLAQQPARQFKAKELARLLHVPPARYAEYRNLLRSLAQQGLVAKLRRNHFAHVQPSSTLTGKLHVKTQGYGFLLAGDGQEEVFISQKNMRTALNGDLVKVELFARPSGRRPEGRVVAILQRSRNNIVGLLQRGRHFYYVKPDDIKLLHDIYIPEENLNDARPGQKVAVTIESWEDELQNPEGRVVKVLGFPGEPGVDVLSVAYAFDLPAAFPPEVEREAENLRMEPTPELLARRLDLRTLLTFTIDPEDAKDFDDAVSLRELDNGHYELGVHIADVSHFVKENSALDREALNRGTSVYLVDRVVPMLPERLSNDLCSLKPDCDRLTFSCLMEITPRGRLVNYQIVETIIHSKKRLNYEQAQRIIDGKESVSPEIDETLRRMNRLARTLTRRRLRNGSLDFDMPEVKVILDEQGHPVEIRRKVRQDSNRLIEEFMLLANQTVAQHIDLTLRRQSKHKPPFIYRIHEAPDPLKMKDFALFVKALGFTFDHQQQVTSKLLSDFLEQVAKTPEADLIENVMLRSLMKAKYSVTNKGHFGLAFQHYSHFTSPIRRYPDLIAHRMLKEYARGYRPELHDWYERKLDYAAQKASERELVALEAERASIKMKQVEFMASFLGEEFDGLISGVVAFGIFVEIPQFMVEGLVHISDLEDDYYVFEEKAYRLKGQNSGRVYRLGDPVRVKVVKVDVSERLLDFVLVEKKPRAARRQRPQEKPPRKRRKK